MSSIDSKSVQLVITSPPYWQLKDYGSPDQIGYHDSYDEYVNNLNLVWQECARVLHPGCRLCVNIGDQFARSVYYGRYKVIPIREQIVRFCETIGFDYMGAIIWQKVTNTKTTGGGVQMGSFPFPRNGVVKIDYEFVLLFKRHGEGPKPSLEQKSASKMTAEEWNTFFAGHWNFSGAKQDKHIAMFPDELPRRLIRMFSFVDETVLDPFAGSGTTGAVARALGRNSVSCEINPDFIPIIRDRLGEGDLNVDRSQIEFTRDNSTVDFAAAKAALPYLCVDPHALVRQVDPKKLSFGSRVEKQEPPPREAQSKVEAIVAPHLLRLAGGQMVRLLGIAPVDDTFARAVEFLKSKIKKGPVELRFDKAKVDGDGNVLAYVYLPNKTFVNAHLVRSGLVGVSDEIPFRLEPKFRRLAASTVPRDPSAVAESLDTDTQELYV